MVVTHQGINPSELWVPLVISQDGRPKHLVPCSLASLTDPKIQRIPLDPTLFPGIPSGVDAHSGFVVEHKKTALQILAEVKRLMAEHSSTRVYLVRVNDQTLLD